MEIRTVEFPFFDRLRHLKYTFPDYQELELRTGKTPGELVQAAMGMSPGALRMLLWAGLKWEDRRVVTPDWVAQQIQKHIEQEKSIILILEKIDEAITASGYFRRRDEGADGGPPNPPIASSTSTMKAESGGQQHEG